MGSQDTLKSLFADEQNASTYSTPLKMQERDNARRGEKYRDLAIRQDSEIKEFRKENAELRRLLTELLEEGRHYSFEQFGQWQSLTSTHEYEVAYAFINKEDS